MAREKQRMMAHMFELLSATEETAPGCVLLRVGLCSHLGSDDSPSSVILTFKIINYMVFFFLMCDS